MKSTLYIVPTPIGNPKDITLRAFEVLKSADLIICEEYKPARRFLSNYEIKSELLAMNEHNEKDERNAIILKILECKNVALISDCGTPVFSDPGQKLLETAIEFGINIITLPGPSSLMTALSGAGIDVDRFYFYGWLPREKDERKRELLELRKRKELIVLMDTPYRLIKILSEIESFFGKNREIILAYELTKPKEYFYRGTVSKIHSDAQKINLKGEFVLLVRNDL
ncbi:MAG: 16S rRNA (cytidine(1402)-2'-O)-methyltransferase [Melioribacteraceae bacterium]|nr:16S rRNA (cytidine(1402)-2'-O)-methyltransferase [Melioribacteraceae bacterium]MCF8265288.1 16S rRNA (cytidine(1402)-2'-O)-methyltransferase [Melioribacteraceae bacterium]MCF8412617.1 16S rRNA (cytidine(1402)-2'-O)-methyltransferase [Melioribacteraceae bacterium]MCF8431519.1 16S rRNA (cytidine(1402)-2'-O)-methyltransferase [Melioribacteraceae bacterium]